MKRLLILTMVILFSGIHAIGQQISKEELIFLTPEWKGERFPDGRPKVPDDLLERLKLVTLEEAWAVLRGHNFNHQYEDGWVMINPDSVLVGRAVTATFMPGRPDIHRVIEDRKSTRLNSSHVKISYAVSCLKKKKKATSSK